LNIGALLHALQTDGNVNVLSTPNILTTDNQKAEIMVGQNVPFTTGQTQNAVTGAGSYFNTIERRDVGIKLSITPQISSDDNVRLEINQEISDVVPAASLAVGDFITNKRSAITTVVVKDRETMVIGGLIRDNVTSSESKVPLLGDIPLLGWLFKYKTSKVEKTNLMIFITPYIIKSENEASEIAQKKSEGLEEFRKEYKIEKKSAQPTMLTVPPHLVETDRESALQSAPTATTEIQSMPTGTAPSAPAGNGASLQSGPTGTSSAAPANGTSGAPPPPPADTGTAPSDRDVPLQSAPSGSVPGAPEGGSR
jgi:general secretion pathway protein D